MSYENSGSNTTFEDLQKLLENHPDIDTGEIRDCLLYFYRQQLIYCEVLGNRDTPYTDFSEFGPPKYLISAKGKNFWETTGGFENAADKFD